MNPGSGTQRRVEAAIAWATSSFARRDVPDAEIAFYMPVFRDAPVAAKALRRIRAAYPMARIVVESDGDPRIPGERICEVFGVTYSLGKNLYGLEHRGEMIIRMFEHFLQGPEHYLIRPDSDARMDRRFMKWPRGSGVYGSIGRRSGAIQGGCILVTRRAAETLLSSGILRSEAITDPESSWGRYSTDANLARKLQLRRIAYDKLLQWACDETGVPVRSHPEILSRWKRSGAEAQRFANVGKRYAVVHPDKMETEADLEGFPSAGLGA